MKIKAIKKQKNGKYKLELEDKSSIDIYGDVILNNDILYEKEINDNLLEIINKENSFFEIYNKLVKDISKKFKTEYEVRKKLIDYNLPDVNIESIINKLKNNGLINDERYVKSYIHDRIKFSNDGPYKIKLELEKKSVDSSIIEKELSLIEHSIYDEKIKNYVLKKTFNNNKYSTSMLKKKISNELYLLGYDSFNIDDYMTCNDDISLTHEFNKLYVKYASKYDEIKLKEVITRKLLQKGFFRENIAEKWEKREIS